MRFSYSNVSTFAQCRYKWFLQYREKLKTIPDTNPGCALWLGLALHKGIEMGSVEAGIDEYKSHFNIITDDHINWIMQLEYQLPKVLELLPSGGEHELELKTDKFIGYADYLCGDTLWDFKFSNNKDNYMTSPQLSLYKSILEKTRPDTKINHLKYLFVPKVQIRQKFKQDPPETLFEFRTRLQEELEKTQIEAVEVPFDPNAILEFEECTNYMEKCVEFPKNPTKLCGWCNFQAYCESDGKEDWMILR